MKKFFQVIFLILGGLSIAFVFAGTFGKVEYQGSLSRTVDAPQDKVWAVLNDIEGLPKRRPDVLSVVIEEKGKDGVPKRWKEEAKGAGMMTFEMAAYKPKSLFAVKLVESPFGMQGTWTYELKPSGSGTEVAIREESKAHDFFTRAIFTLMGRDLVLKQEMEYLIRGLK